MFLNLFHFVIGFYPGILYQVYVVNKFNALTKYSKNYAQLKRIQISCQNLANHAGFTVLNICVQFSIHVNNFGIHKSFVKYINEIESKKGGGYLRCY